MNEMKDAIVYKKCIKCNIEKELEHFRKNKKSKDDYRSDYKDCLKKYNKKYREYNREYNREYAKKYIETNKEYCIEYRVDNKERNANWQKNWRENNPHIIVWWSVLNNYLRRMCLGKKGYTIDMLGYSEDDLKTHTESLFTDGMSWYNHGEWHIDHKIPVSKFKKDTPVSVVNSLENLQPLWAKDNLSKLDKILDEFKSMAIYKYFF